MSDIEVRTPNLLERSLGDDPAEWPYFSFSQLTTYDRCEFKWYLSYIESWTPKFRYAPAMNIGSMVHVMLDLHYKNLNLDTLELVEDYLHRLVKDELEASGDPDTLNEIARAGTIARRYIKSYAPKEDKGMIVQAAEKHFSTPFKTPKDRNFILLGYVDLLIFYQGALIVVDHKTVSNAGFWKPGETQMDPQMTLYVAALKKEGYAVGEIMHNFLNTYPYKNIGNVPDAKLFKREVTHRSEKEIENFTTELLREIDEILDNAGSEDWKPRRSLRRECARCDFKDPCYYSMKGIDVAGVMNSKFKKKENSGHGIR